MAELQGYEINKAAQMDYAEHRRTYSGFLAMFKYGTIAVIVLLILMAMFLL
ncbi:aa3-type cytochrome c oxidase subunit IV [Aureimonas sp. Leaf454]|uniref:aa3-type cytochrome c oxidase subunit IV n=1 Tax=Aureimonas sp. Leaf454 TaxID=1736381 RepID=UPI0009EC16C6|nr:aa3-type cytochrome c oxidase subunit IV [Aureimonas sp. Leaf454]